MLKKIFSAALTGIFFITTGFAQKNLIELGHLPFPGKTLAGVWHYSNGINEYALAGTSTGLSIVDVTNPATPVLLFDIPGVNSLWREVKTYSHYAYVSTEGGGGITIVDLDSLPLAVNYKTYTGDGAIAGVLDRAHTVQAENGYLYINGSANISPGGVVICSLTDPWNPVYVGQENLRYAHDCFVRNDTLWASEIYDGQFSVYDITDKTSPVLLATQATPGAFNHNAWLSDDSRFLFTTDEHANTPLGVFDVSDLTNIKSADLYYTNLNPTAEVHNVRVLNDFLINPSYGNSLYGTQVTICDAARPHNIIETGNFPLSGAGAGLKLSWDASPYLPSGNMLVTDVDSGLYILAPTYVRGCYLEGVVTDSLTGALLNNVLVEILLTPVIDSTILTGEYKTGLADAGSYSVKFTKPGYFPKTFNNVSLTNGVLTVLDVQLWDGTVGTPEISGRDIQVTVSPNPFSDKTTFYIPSGLIKTNGNISITIMDITGRIVKEYKNIDRSSFETNLNGMEKGIYLYEVKSASKTIQKGKLILE